MQSNEIHETIAQQVNHMKPPDLKPGVDIGMAALNETTLLVRVLPAEPNDERSKDVHIIYNEGRDMYEVHVWQRGEKDEYSDVFCDQLGELCFGEHAVAWSQPFGSITTFNADGSVASEETF
jgi:hypothetical protein